MTLVNAFDRVAYSGMIPSTLAGIYSPSQMVIDLVRLCERSQVRLLVDRVTRLHPDSRSISLAHHPHLEFDVAAINIGSVPAGEHVWQARRNVVGVKPLTTFIDRFENRFREMIHQRELDRSKERIQFSVVGAGVAGIELALCLEQRNHDRGLEADVCLIDGQPEILCGDSTRSIRKVRKLLKRRGIDLELGSRAVDFDDDGPGMIVLENGKRIRSDLAIWATGPSAPVSLSGFELPKSESGFLATHRTLQSTHGGPIFVSGDVAEIEGLSVPKSGVYSVRQGPVLQSNLHRYLSNLPLLKFQPQVNSLSLLACGDETAILRYGGFTVHSRWAWYLKNWIDQSWVKRFSS